MRERKRFLLRMVIPAYPKWTIYSNVTGITTALGPLCVATAAAKLDHWDVEVIDENNCRDRHCPRGTDGYPDHAALQALRPADVVGFYGSMSSSVPKLYRLAHFYREAGTLTVAGGKHIEFLPREALDNHVDIAVLGEGEETIREILLAWEVGHRSSEGDWRNARGTDGLRNIEGIRGIAWRRDAAPTKAYPRAGGNPPLSCPTGFDVVMNPPRAPNHDLDSLPWPDFGLLRYARLKIYPVNRTRGCNMNCEFCTVKDRARTASPQWLANQIIHLVETRGAREFFDTSDHFASNRAEAIEFCRLMADYQQRSGIRLDFTVQTRITDARYPDLLAAMKAASIHMVAIGFESPIDEELLSMNKGYLSRDMVAWARIFRRYGFYVHAMMIFGYPVVPEHRVSLPVAERMARFRRFLRQARVSTTQVLLAIPFAGTGLRARLEQDNRVLPLSGLGWEYYDGQFPLFEPDDGSTPEENQQAIERIMGRFYSPWNLAKVIAGMVIHFPRLILLPALATVTFRVSWVVQAFWRWYHDYARNQLVRFGGSFIVRNWKKQLRQDRFADKLRTAREALASLRKT